MATGIVPEGDDLFRYMDRFRIASEPIRRELIDLGFEIESLEDLHQQNKPYVAAIPVLVQWLPRVENEAVKEVIVRALSIPASRGVANETLLREFVRILDSESSLKWAIGNAISVIGQKSDCATICDIVKRPEHGIARQMLVVAIGKLCSEDSEDVLLSLLNDAEVAGHVAIALGRVGTSTSLGPLAQLTRHPVEWIRNEAKRTIQRINKRLNRDELSGHQL